MERVKNGQVTEQSNGIRDGQEVLKARRARYHN